MIPLLDLTEQYHRIKEEIDQAVHVVLESGHFILGPNVKDFEQEVADYLGVTHAIGLASGTDALVIALRALGIGPGDEVIVPAYTFFASAGAVMTVGARPVIVDVDPETYVLTNRETISRAITSRTKAIVPVHLYGYPAHMDEIRTVAENFHLKIIEDNAQAFGAEFMGQKTASLGDIGCLSFFPTKNLGAYGDGGMVVTNDDLVAEKMRMLRTHGWRKKYFPEMLGYNSRLDEIQAAVLRVKLRHLDEWNDQRRQLAKMYRQALSSIKIGLPVEDKRSKHVYHLFVIRVEKRDDVQAKLKEAGIACEVYYPQPPHLTTPCRKLGYQEGDFPIAERLSKETLAIPFYPEMSGVQFEQVVTALNAAVNGF